MISKNKIKKMWLEIDEHMGIMSSYLDKGELPENIESTDILRLMIKCLEIVVGELYTNSKNYEKYPAINYTEEDFVDMVIETIGKEKINKNDSKSVVEYVEEFRSVLWGNAKQHYNDYLRLYVNFNDYADEDFVLNYLKECMTIVTMESLLKKMMEHMTTVEKS